MLTWRANAAGTLRAAYLGACRVGYVGRSVGRWYWHAYLVRPEGGCYMGVADDPEEAVEALETAVAEWAAHAGLAPQPNS